MDHSETEEQNTLQVNKDLSISVSSDEIINQQVTLLVDTGSTQ